MSYKQPSIDHGRLISILLDYIRNETFDISIADIAAKLDERSCDTIRTIHSREDVISYAIKHDIYFVSSNIKTKLNEDAIKWSKTVRAPSRIVLVKRGGIVDYLAANVGYQMRKVFAGISAMRNGKLDNLKRGGMCRAEYSSVAELARRSRL